MANLKVLFLGDIVGVTGCAMFQKHIDWLRQEYQVDALIVNGENSSDGHGITSRIVRFFKHNHVNVITSGNHVWHNKEIYPYLAQHDDLLRPANYPSDLPGTGVTTFALHDSLIAIINLQGRVFMREHLACPFRTAETLLTFLRDKTKVIFIDFHAEATSEKRALGYFLDGKISGLVGTHTHIQTADEQILPNGTAYITDLGMAGSLNSLLGMKSDPIIRRFLTQVPVRFSVETSSPVILTGALIEVDTQTGSAIDIKRIILRDDSLDIKPHNT